ncbi:hypothetical protein ZWY2020_000102 [Hordeum vulgare]|nr:hypothetical protein ZWY2020_000102 [Hordeum vulgare]
MDKYMPPICTSVLLLSLLLLICIPTPTLCQIMDGMDNRKVSLPNGLCIHKEKVHACHVNRKCYCCDVTNLCYLTIDLCKKNC